MINLQKGANINLSKATASLKKLKIGLGWSVRVTDGADFDLDGSVFMLNAAGKARSAADFVFYGAPQSACGSVIHHGDNKTGDNAADAETITVELDKVPAEIEKIVFTVTIHEADQRSQNFGQVSNAYIRCINEDGGEVLARFDLTEDGSTETAVIFGELYRHSGDWKFKAVSQGYAGGLLAMCATYGLQATNG